MEHMVCIHALYTHLFMCKLSINWHILYAKIIFMWGYKEICLSEEEHVTNNLEINATGIHYKVWTKY